MARTRRRKKSRSRRLSLKAGVVLTLFLAVWGAVSQWYVHHPRKWLQRKSETWPKIATAPLLWFGNPLADLTDALGWTGHDAVYEYDEAPPSGKVLFAGVPARTGAPAPEDIRIIDRGEFVIGWSDSLRHPVWCAYHVTALAKYDVGERPGFTKDASVAAAPRPADYTKSGFDRGHMVPNYAIMTRYGEDARRKTFMMSNISPQAPALNRGVWREVEHRIADLWTERYGEIWVVVGCIPDDSGEKLSGTGIDVPSAYYQVIIAQEGMNVRALALLFDRTVPWREWAARNIISIDELEKLSGFDFNPNMPAFIQDPLEAETPSRLWPIRAKDIFRQILLRFP
jgi:endonuclease G